MNKGIRAIILLLLFIAVAVSAAEEEGGSGKHFFWRIQSDISTVYILGSLHAGKKDMYPMAPVIEKAFEDADFLAVECDMTESQNMVKIQKLIQESGMYGEGKSLKTEIHPEIYKKIEAAVKDLGLDMGGMEKLKPWLLMINLAGVKAMKIGLDPAMGVDRYFMNKAKGKKPIISLESPEIQLKALATLSEKSQEAKVLQDIDEIDRMEEIFTRMLQYWRDGNVSGMEDLVFEPLRKPDAREIKKVLFDDRDKAMADKIEAFLQDKKTAFVVVGAFHLVRGESILALLKERGYVLTQW